MTMIKAILVDDEPLARDSIRILLERYPKIEIVDECGDGSTALESIQINKPHLVFLDIQMPGLNGIELVKALGTNPPAIIFLTAYDSYALKAFELHAVDYLMKPFSDERFFAAVNHAIKNLEKSFLEETNAKVLRALQAYESLASEDEQNGFERLVLKNKRETLMLRQKNIEVIEAENYYVNIRYNGKPYLHRETMTQITKRLNPKLFLRIHRSRIINIDRIEKMYHDETGELYLVYESGSEFKVGRTYKTHVSQMLGLH